MPYKILIAPLNWGLGHATRCMPIINELLERGCEVLIASDGRTLALLQAEYPQLKAIEIPGYQIHYQSGEGGFVKTMVGQIPKILHLIYKEHRKLQQIVTFYEVDAVISDNRFGCWSKKVPCVFMTHQLFIKMPTPLRFLEPSVKWANFGWIRQYDRCWVPDFADPSVSLSGDLAHQFTVDKERFRFIGPLSRLKTNHLIDTTLPVSKLDILMVLSGPEPQRTLFEELLLKQAKEIDRQVLLVRGVTEKQEIRWKGDRICVINYLTATNLNAALLEAKVVIARAGYSTIMDLVALEKTAILVPTPEQTEQEYLAHSFQKRGLFFAVDQDNFNLKHALERVTHYSAIPVERTNKLTDAIDELLGLVKISKEKEA